MKPTVYIETSVIGYLTSWPSGDLIVAARQKITRDWWRDAPAKFALLVSDVVLNEAGTGDPQAAQDRLAAIQGLPILPPSQEAQDLTNAGSRADYGAGGCRPYCTCRREWDRILGDVEFQAYCQREHAQENQ
jgi:hypothetical protein